VEVKKVVYIYIKIVFFSFLIIHQIYAESKISYSFSSEIDRYIPKKVQTNKKRMCTIDFDINEHLDEKLVNVQQEKWNKLNTGTYTYLYNNSILLFVENNKVKKSLVLHSHKVIDEFITKLIQNRNQTKKYLMKKLRFYNLLSSIDDYLIDRRFITVMHGNWHTKCYCNRYEIQIEYSGKYGHITSLVEIKPKKCIYERHNIHDFPSQRYSYGLLMLSKETKYTDKVVEKILNKYEKAWKCEKKLLASKKTNNEQNLTLLEKAVGKEKLECLDKYLVWDENESK